VKCSPFRLFLLTNTLALLFVSIWLRVHALDNIPGINGDEAWYGVEAWRVVHGEAASWHTPTGNPLNPFWLGPLTLLHLWLPPSIVLLRSVAVAWGLAALAVNWLLCRWVFDRTTAAVSTLILAILPIDIAYSRFAWDASQSLAATLPVIYLALAAARFPDRFGRWIALSGLAMVVACWVHPTNAFVGAAILVASVANLRAKLPGRSPSAPASRFVVPLILALAGALAAIWFYVAYRAHGPMPGRIAQRLTELSQPSFWNNVPWATVLYPRLLIGGTIYRFIPGSRSWFEVWQFDIVLFWTVIVAAAWSLWHSSRLRRRNQPDGLLLAAWALQLIAFLLIAGPGAMSPGWERFSLCLIGPTVIVLARGAAIAWQAASPRGRLLLAFATLAGWLPLADFNANYFQFIGRTGGQAHLTFRTAPVEPKQAALQFIQEQAKNEGGARFKKVPGTVAGTAQRVLRTTVSGTLLNHAEKGSGPGPLWIVCSEWWNRWPIRYLALPDPGVYVPEPDELGASDDYRRAVSAGRVWSVEFRQEEARQPDPGVIRQTFCDYGGRPLIDVLHKSSP
jgi:hypothetical protein